MLCPLLDAALVVAGKVYIHLHGCYEKELEYRWCRFLQCNRYRRSCWQGVQNGEIHPIV